MNDLKFALRQLMKSPASGNGSLVWVLRLAHNAGCRSFRDDSGGVMSNSR